MDPNYQTQSLNNNQAGGVATKLPPFTNLDPSTFDPAKEYNFRVAVLIGLIVLTIIKFILEGPRHLIFLSYWSYYLTIGLYVLLIFHLQEGSPNDSAVYGWLNILSQLQLSVSFLVVFYYWLINYPHDSKRIFAMTTKLRRYFEYFQTVVIHGIAPALGWIHVFTCDADLKVENIKYLAYFFVLYCLFGIIYIEFIGKEPIYPMLDYRKFKRFLAVFTAVTTMFTLGSLGAMSINKYILSIYVK